MTKIKLLRIFDIIQGDEKLIKLSFISDEDIDFSQYKARFTIKEYKNAKTPGSEYILSKSEIPVNKDYVEIELIPEETIKFPITKQNKPLVMAIGLYNKDMKYSKEWHIGLNVYPSVNNNLY